MNAVTSPYHNVRIGSDLGWQHTGSKSLMIETGFAQPTIAIMPEFATPLNQLKVEFWYRTGNPSATRTIELGYLADVNDANSFAALRTLPGTMDFSFYELSLDTIPDSLASVSRIAFRYSVTYQSTYVLAIDDISVSYINSCTTPGSPSVSSTDSNSAVVAWTPAGSCGLRYRMTGDNAWTVLTPSASPYTLTGLASATRYEVGIRTLCSASASSLWSIPTCFTTQAADSCITLGAGTETNGTVPVNGAMAMNEQRSQSIYPADSLSHLAGKDITALKYYVEYGSNEHWSDVEFTVKMDTTNQQNLQNSFASSPSATVYHGRLTANTDEDMLIVLDAPFRYNGGNLLIEIEKQQGGINRSVTFYGQYKAAASRLCCQPAYHEGSNAIDFLPKLSLYYADPQPVFHLDAASNDTTMGIVEGAGDYESRTDVVLRAVAQPNHIFLSWADGVEDNPREVTVKSDTSFLALFAALRQVTAEANDPQMGTVTGSGTYVDGTTATLAAQAAPEHVFVRWTDGSVENPRQVVVVSDTAFVAVFQTSEGIAEAILPNLVIAAAHHSISVSGTEGNPVWIFDVQGRLMGQSEGADSRRFQMPAAGIYLVKVGASPVRKIVLID